MNRIPILDCVPEGYTLRPQQIKALLFIEENYDKKSFLCVNAPTGCGKSLLAMVFNSWVSQNGLGRSADVVPNKALQDQYTETFPSVPDLKGQSSYVCSKLANGGSCADYKRLNHEKKLCGGSSECKYMAAKADCSSAPAAIFNYHSYMYNEMWTNKDHLVNDEGHNVFSFLEGLYTINLYACEYDFGPDVKSDVESVRTIIGDNFNRIHQEVIEATARKVDSKIIEELEELENLLGSVNQGLAEFPNDILIVKKTEVYKKRKWLRKDMKAFYDTEQTVIKIKPMNVSKIGPRALWPEEIKKVLFLSATINQDVMDDLGITPDHVEHFECDSPIPPENRKFIAWPIASMSYRNQKDSLPKILDAIKAIAKKNNNVKGLIHCTYETARYLKNQITDSRYLFHDNQNKNDVYQQFRASKEPKILVASGMSEGIDLPGDLARFQIILKVPYPSLMDDVWAWKCQNRPRAYAFETIKTIIQQAGRICRGPTDYGTTYMLDAEFESFYKKVLKYKMVPKWFQDGVILVKVKE